MQLLEDLHKKIDNIKKDVEEDYKLQLCLQDRVKILEDIIMGVEEKKKKRKRKEDEYYDVFVKVLYNNGDITEDRLTDVFSSYSKHFKIVMIADNRKFAQISFPSFNDKDFCLSENKKIEENFGLIVQNYIKK